MDFQVLVGTAGVSLLLVAFFLNLFKFLGQDTKAYALLNIFGAGLAGYASVLIHYVPFVVLESVWALVALIGFFRALRAA